MGSAPQAWPCISLSSVFFATVTGRSFQLHIEHVAFGEVQPRSDQQHPHICLHRRFGASTTATSQPSR